MIELLFKGLGSLRLVYFEEIYTFIQQQVIKLFKNENKTFTMLLNIYNLNYMMSFSTFYSSNNHESFHKNIKQNN